jgi:DNA-binding LytR/AlgR family response regulator
MSSLRIAICEDDDKDAKHLSSLIRKSGVYADISFFKNGEAFLDVQPMGKFDLVFLDIYMGSITGIEVARILRNADGRCGIVFTTSSEDFRSEAFDVGASQYLIKPVEKEKLFKVLKKRKPDRRRKICTINVKGTHVDIPYGDIMYVEVKNHNCIVHTIDDEIDTGTTMTIENFINLLPDSRFMRCHKSYIVNLSFVQSVDRDFLMKNGDTVYIRRSDHAKCKKWESELDKWRLDEAGKGGD